MPLSKKKSLKLFFLLLSVHLIRAHKKRKRTACYRDLPSNDLRTFHSLAADRIFRGFSLVNVISRSHAHRVELKWPSSGGAVGCSQIVLQLNLFQRPTDNDFPSATLNTPTLYPSTCSSVICVKDLLYAHALRMSNGNWSDKRNVIIGNWSKGWKLICRRAEYSEQNQF